MQKITKNVKTKSANKNSISFNIFLLIFKPSKFKSCFSGIRTTLFLLSNSYKGSVKVLHSIYQQIQKMQQWSQDWKRSVFIPIPKKGNAKECSNYHTIVLISHVCKVILKTLQARLQQYMNQECPSVQCGFRKDRGLRDQIANILWMREKSRELQKEKKKKICFIDYSKAFM